MANTLKFRGGSTSDITSSTVSDREIIFDTDKNTLVLGSAKDYLMRYGGNNQSGNVGIGVASPSTALEVSGTVTATAFAGPLTGNVTGNAATATTATSATSATTATRLAIAREINGTSFDGTANIVIGNIPQNSQTSSSSYQLNPSDAGKHISTTNGGVTVVYNAQFNVGDAVSIFNNSTSNRTITQGSSVTLIQAGTANTGDRTLAQNGICTVLCVEKDTNAGTIKFVVTGAGLL